MSRVAPKIYFSAGDPSGDQHAAAIITVLQQQLPDVECRGLGGPAMAAVGFESYFAFERFNRMGYVDVIKDLPFFLRAKKLFIQKLAEERPDVLVCVDYSGFNRPLMKAARALDIPVYWYVAPMIWAWKKKKHGSFLAKYATHIGTILPFEKEHWLPFTSEVSYVGNPLLEELVQGPVRAALSKESPGTLALIPGSRRGEVATMLPQMLAVAEILHEKYPTLQITLSQAETLPADLFADIPAYVTVQKGAFQKLLIEADMALVTSGTATLQAALAGLPHAIMYRTSRVNYILMRWLLRKLSWIGLPNIIAGKTVVPEYIQNYSLVEISKTIVALVEDQKVYLEQVQSLEAIGKAFGEKHPSQEVASQLISMIGGGAGAE